MIMSAKMLKVASALGATALLGACQGGGAGGGGVAASPVRSNFETDAAAVVSASLSEKRNREVSDPAVGLVAFATGLDLERGQAVAISGVQAGANVGAPVNSGTATYDTKYAYTALTDTTRSGGYISGLRVTVPETDLALSADFDNGTLTGSDANITFNATISGSNVGGTALATPRILGRQRANIPMNVDGQIGDTGVIGAFAGNESDNTASGGFVGRKR